MPAPTNTNERYIILDILRGFALLGVIVANMSTHSGYFFMSQTDQQSVDSFGIDGTVSWWLHFLVDGKFYSLFSLLFGIGFAIQMKRAQEKNEPFAGRYMRRIFILFIIGLLHAILFYVGDILTVYALLGFVLILFRNASNKTLLTTAIILLILPVVQYAIFWLPSIMATEVSLPPTGGRPPLFDMLIQTYQGGNFLEIMKMNIGGLVMGRYPDLIFTGRFFRVLAMFLLGFYITRHMLFSKLDEKKAFLKKIMIGGAAIGIPMNIILANMMETNAYYAMQPMGIIQPLVYAYGVPALSLSYTSAIALIFISNKRKILLFFAPVGQMALTNYLVQSVICAIIFMGYGFGWFAKVGILYLLFIGLAIYVVQVLYSRWWMAHYRFGPMEWLWRRLTYRQKISINKPVVQTAY
jgi:uncharacterized protein